MDQGRYRRIKELFGEARVIDGAGLAAFLDEACGDDAELRREVLELIESERQAAGSAIGRALSETGVDAAPRSTPARIGRYRVSGICGHGGMGTVFEAEQDSPRRRVALKVIQSGHAKPEILRRFRREAEILGRLQHPGIAQVFEAGEFEQDGLTRPFIAMEFVEGAPLLRFAEQSGASVSARIELIASVCDAVEHAHEQGVVHRDLKPDNVLVVEGSAGAGGRGRPMVLDFGVARLVGEDLQSTISTGAGQLLGSVPYMSPEQAAGDPLRIGRASDVYSIGVMLYELLTGRLPLELRERPLVDALDTIRNELPTPLGTLEASLAGDLQTIVGKCLEKEPERRYPSAAAVADELRRFLRSEPIRARPPSTWYQIARFTRRHRGVAVGAATALVALVVGLVVAVVFAVKASRSAELAIATGARAEREAYRANLGAASALMESDPRAARQALEAVPASTRGWEWTYLNSRIASPLVEFGELASEPELAAPAPFVVLAGGQQLVALTAGDQVELFEVASGRSVDTITAPALARAWAVASDGARVAAGFEDGRVLVLDRADSVWQPWLALDEPIQGLAFQPQSERLAVVTRSSLSIGAPDEWIETPLKTGGEDAPRIEFSPDGTRLAAITLRGSTHFTLWDSRELEVLMSRPSPASAVSLGFSPDGSAIAFGGVYREIAVIDARDGTLLAELIGHEQPVIDVALDDRGRLLSTSSDGTVRLWDLSRAEPLAVFSEARVRAAAFAADDRIVTGSAERLGLWSTEPRRAKVLGDHGSYVYDLCFSPDGLLLASYAYFATELSIWDVASGELLIRQAASGGVTELGFDDERDELWLTGWTRTQFVPWMVERSTKSAVDLTPTVAQTLLSSGTCLSLQLAEVRPFAPPERLAVWRNEFDGLDGAGSQGDQLARAWLEGEALPMEPASSRVARHELGELPHLFVGALAGGDVSFTGWVAELLFYDGMLGESEAAAVERYLDARRSGADGLELPPVASARLIAHFRADESSIGRDAEDGEVEGWRAANDPRLVLSCRGSSPSVVTYHESAPGADCPALRFSPDRRQHRWLDTAFPAAGETETLTVFALAKHTGPVASCLYSIDSPARRHDAPRDPGTPRTGAATCFSADGRLIALGDSDSGNHALVREVESGEVRLELVGDHLGVAISPDGRRLACGDVRGAVELWDIATGEQLAALDGHTGAVYALAFTPDGTRLATAGNDQQIVVRDAQTLEPLLELRGHRMYVKALVFSPDGLLLASASGDGSVRLWDSAPPAVRYRAAIEQRELEEELRDEVEALMQARADRAEWPAAIRAAWPDDSARRRAAQRIVAREPFPR